MRNLRLVGCLGILGLFVACSKPASTPEASTEEGGTGQVDSAAVDGISVADLEREAASIVQISGNPVVASPEVADPTGALPRLAPPDRKPPPNASAYPQVTEASMTLVTSPATRTKRDAPKAAVEGGREVPRPSSWRALGFAGATYEPQRGVDAALLAPSDRAKGRGYTYAFVVLTEQLSDSLEKELRGLGVQLLGRHGGAQKARVPIDATRLRAIAAVPGVESISYARKDQKIEKAARDAAARFAKQLPGLPVIVSAFDGAALEELLAWLRTANATVGRVDPQLFSIWAVIPADQLDALTDLDTVLYVELSRPTTGGHDFSIAVMGADYIRAGGVGTRFSGAPIILGILDTGFMVVARRPPLTRT